MSKIDPPNSRRNAAFFILQRLAAAALILRYLSRGIEYCNKEKMYFRYRLRLKVGAG